MNEIEVKILRIDKQTMIRRMEEMGLQKVKDEHQVNTIYDFPDLPLLAKKGYARVREIQDRLTGQDMAYMTVKIMLSQEKYKIMEEHETLVEDTAAAHGIYQSLGMIQRKILIKDRISYQYKNTLIEIDDVEAEEYPFPLMEVETQDETELKEIVALLGYTMADTTSLTMTEILAAQSGRTK